MFIIVGKMVLRGVNALYSEKEGIMRIEFVLSLLKQKKRDFVCENKIMAVNN